MLIYYITNKRISRRYDKVYTNIYMFDLQRYEIGEYFPQNPHIYTRFSIDRLNYIDTFYSQNNRYSNSDKINPQFYTLIITNI